MKMNNMRRHFVSLLIGLAFFLSSSVLANSDFNDDGDVNLSDFATMALRWMNCQQPDDPACTEPVDADGDLLLPGGHVRIRIQTPQVISGPGNRDDVFHLGFKTGDTVSSYMGNGYSYNFRGATFESAIDQSDYYADSTAALVPGSDIDDGGAWLMHAEVDPVDPNFVRGWYHAEKVTDYDTRRWSQAYAESHDGGAHFTKTCDENPSLNYPNNQWITCWSDKIGALGNDDTGVAHITTIGDYYYAFYLDTIDWQYHAARSALSDRGLPGTWWKYYAPPGTPWNQGGFTESGLGGKSTSPFPNNYQYQWLNQVNWNPAVNKFMNLAARYWSGYSGLYLGLSDDPLFNWSTTGYPFLVYEGAWAERPNWDRATNPNELHGYSSICPINSINSESRLNDQFWYIVNSYVNPLEGFTERYFLRQKMDLTKTFSTNPIDHYTRIELALYRNDQNDDEWSTSYNTFGHYRKLETLGYVISASANGAKPLYGLYDDELQDHLLSNGSTQATKLRLLGYVFMNQVAGTIPLYRTYDPVAMNHSATTDSNDPQIELLLGYIFPPVGDETFVFYYNSIDQTERKDGITVPTLAGQQGYFNWYYQERHTQDGSLVNMQYNPGSGGVWWWPTDIQIWSSTIGSAAMLTPYGGEPGSTSRAVRTWKTVDNGYVYITAKAWDMEPDSGDGVDAIIAKNGTPLWTRTLSHTTRHEAAFGLNVQRGDAITFEIDPRNNNVSDRTYFCPTIRFQWHDKCDLNKDNHIDFDDFIFFAKHWL